MTCFFVKIREVIWIQVDQNVNEAGFRKLCHCGTFIQTFSNWFGFSFRIGLMQ